jgi:hypothetical protein
MLEKHLKQKQKETNKAKATEQTLLNWYCKVSFAALIKSCSRELDEKDSNPKISKRPMNLFQKKNESETNKSHPKTHLNGSCFAPGAIVELMRVTSHSNSVV